MRQKSIQKHIKQKTRNQDKSESEHLKGIIRELGKEIRQLKQLVRQYEKREQNPEPKIDPSLRVTLDQRLDCDECGKGKYDELVLLDKVYGTCDLCGSRKRLK